MEIIKQGRCHKIFIDGNLIGHVTKSRSKTGWSYSYELPNWFGPYKSKIEAAEALKQTLTINKE